MATYFVISRFPIGESTSRIFKRRDFAAFDANSRDVIETTFCTSPRELREFAGY